MAFSEQDLPFWRVRVSVCRSWGGRSTAECEREVMELWPEKTLFTKMDPSPQLPVLVAFLGLSFPSPLESSMLIYFLWAIIYYLHYNRASLLNINICQETKVNKPKTKNTFSNKYPSGQRALESCNHTYHGMACSQGQL